MPKFPKMFRGAVATLRALPGRRLPQRLAACCTALLLALGMPIAATASPAPAKTSSMFEDFTVANGAVTVFAHGDYVEPYTAIKAMLIAHRLGVNVHAPATAFAQWLLRYQQANGPFPRICRSGNAEWLACGPADADDSLAVFWCLLVTEVLKGEADLAASCGKSLQNLATLWDPQRGTFRATFGQTVAYFADNVEIIGALDRLRADPNAATRHARELAALPSRRSMIAGLARNYGYDPTGALEPERASLPATPYGFYPNAVAPVYLWIYDVSTGPAAARKWAVWKHRYGTAWLEGKSDHYPWGLIAWAAYKLGDRQTAAAWLRASAQWRQQGRWNVLEEGVRIGLSRALSGDSNLS
ncbi:hypothetical protein BJN34_33495 [Cupriavidus necator]|uniref:Uncharacterized protein n=1 Tax=Cupriavidus necator TaxID=106590 RepID=A0A1U9V2D4_CUPNE|nr:hypothetical protein BJN34_33495 [Cupriavidus necator]